jgi:3-oxoacyl-[acyl-carrier-protein] synthase II
VTGVGLVSPVGMGTQANWDALCAGTSGIGPIHAFRRGGLFDAVRGRSEELRSAAVHRKKELKKMDIFIQFAVAGRRSSRWTMPGWTIDAALAPRIGVFIGSGIGGFTTIESSTAPTSRAGPRKISPFFIPSAIINLAAGQVSIPLRREGPEPGDVHRLHGVGARHRRFVRDHQARRGRRDDHGRRGGGGLPHGHRRLRGVARAVAAQRRSARASRPFDKDRDGFVLGEGAGILILEELEMAKRRGAQIYAEIVGYGMSGDAYHMTAPVGRRRRRRRVMQAALDRAGVKADVVDYINAHGTSTPHNDRIETTAIKRTFGDHAHKLAISSTKSMTGHLLGAAGGLEAGISALAVEAPDGAADDQPRHAG